MDSQGFSETILRIRREVQALEIKNQNTSLKSLLEMSGPKGHAFLALILILPFLQPIPLPGLSTLVGLAIVVVSFFLCTDRPARLPTRLARVEISAHTLVSICITLEKFTSKMERWIRPRGKVFFSTRGFRAFNAALMCLNAGVMALPLPIPFTNFLPALTVFLLALGILEEDLLVIILGYVSALAGLAYFVLLVFIPLLGWHALKS